MGRVSTWTLSLPKEVKSIPKKGYRTTLETFWPLVPLNQSALWSHGCKDSIHAHNDKSSAEFKRVSMVQLSLHKAITLHSLSTQAQLLTFNGKLLKWSTQKLMFSKLRIICK